MRFPRTLTLVWMAILTAVAYDEAGADELVFLDITASHERRATMIDVVHRTAAEAFMPVTVGGGIRTLDDIRALLRAGADKVSLNTVAVDRPEFVAEAAQRFGTQCIVVAIDAKRAGAGSDFAFEVYTHGGRTPRGLDAIEWARQMEEAGAGDSGADGVGAGGAERNSASRVRGRWRGCRGWGTR